MLTGLKDWSCGYEIESCRKKKDGKTEEDENEDEDEQVKSEETFQECPASIFPVMNLCQMQDTSRLSDKENENNDGVTEDGERAPALEKVTVDLSKFRPFFR